MFRLTIISLLLASSAAYTVQQSSRSSSLVGTKVSAFGGSILLDRDSSCSSSNNNMITMKKGKANVPPHMRGNYNKQREINAMREEMVAAQKPGADGLPVFNLFVQSPVGNMWYPCGSFKGDEGSKALATNYKDGGLLSGISKNQLDAGIAGSLYRDQSKLEESIFRAYPQLRKSKGTLKFGYKLSFDGLSKDQSQIQTVEPKEQKGGIFDRVKGSFGL